METQGFKKIAGGDLQTGMRFSAPLFFEDGRNMFLAEGKSLKPYHLAAVARWNVPFVVTYGKLISDTDKPENGGIEDLEPLDELEELQ
ncbi:hypothetical protein [Treponema brennaborense]|uniref:HD domain-containing protein n=1 Tax=Treponema brennaborense (strain DSM 12168 / CIP 105900 / DD5/3) TaxID=906968 RepID=F4LJ88_TREBD|nr:hypothetical protein [Treponema brennaborense]AEE16345.1 HD domain-containing protein [Treponema brennaborense DSM 12168]